MIRDSWYDWGVFFLIACNLGIGEDWVTLGTISLDVHVVQVGEANRVHEGYSSYYRRDEGCPLSSATPFSSTEVTSLRKIATFIFKYRPLGMCLLRAVDRWCLSFFFSSRISQLIRTFAFTYLLPHYTQMFCNITILLALPPTHIPGYRG